jgi:hypothetical protein
MNMKREPDLRFGGDHGAGEVAAGQLTDPPGMDPGAPCSSRSSSRVTVGTHGSGRFRKGCILASVDLLAALEDGKNRKLDPPGE